MNLHPIQISASINDIGATVHKADDCLSSLLKAEGCNNPEWEINMAWYLQVAFTKLLALSEAVGLPLLRSDIMVDFRSAKTNFHETEEETDNEPFLKWSSCIRCYLMAIQCAVAFEPSRTVTKDLETILRSSTYSICDLKVFGKVPGNEQDVHLRVEAVLKCLFSDLKHKPTLTKPIKNFEPDTGIPSLGTLIEYKFLNDEKSVARIADELLADSRGYHSREWNSFFYVIYETRRFRPELEWRLLLRECGIDERSNVIVIPGVS